MRLANKCTSVSGGGGGIGGAVAVAFDQEGAQVAGCGGGRKKLDAVAAQIGPACMRIVSDVSISKQVELAVRMTLQHFGRITTVVNNAGALVAGTAESLSEDDWEHTFNVNVRGTWLLSRAALPHLREAGGGSIINIGSSLSLVGARNRVAYTASKAPVLGLTRPMALDHPLQNICVHRIRPVLVETEMIPPFNAAAAARQQRLGVHPAGRFGQPADVAALAVFLASDQSAWTT